MCNLTHCRRCEKFSWTGCGKHLKKIFEKVKQEDLCKCDKLKYDKAYPYTISRDLSST